MIERLTLATGGPGLIHRLVEPSVYLDHWALLTLSGDADLRRRFRTALEARGGTLAVSWVNVAEFAKVERRETARQAEEFLEENLPRLFFLEVNPFVVEQRRRRSESYADLELAGVFAGLTSKVPKSFTAEGLFSVMSGRGLDQLNRWNEIYVRQMEALRKAYVEDPDFEKTVERSLKEGGRDSATVVIVKELARLVMRATKTPINENDAQDFFHTVVPVAYCHWVLLDGHWREQVRQVGDRLRRAGVGSELATVFSRGENGVDRFLEALERG